MLEEALLDFPGTVLMVSHDRYLIDRLATQIWELRDGRLHVYAGGYAAYLAARQAERAAAAEARAAAREVSPDAQRRTARSAASDQPVEDVESLVATIHEEETRLNDLAEAMVRATEEQDWAEVQSLEQAYRARETHLTALMARWERAEAAA